MNYFDIPIFIISYNRYTCLKQLVTRLQNDGYKNIIIVDNKSEDETLLQYYKSLASSQSCKVVRLEENYGHRVIWESGEFSDIIENQYYVVTDPDIIPVEECPGDYIEKFYNLLIKYPQYTKVGFSLMLSDLPVEYKYRTDIWRWESFFWEHPIDGGAAYVADLDTTFALYRPVKKLNNDWYYEDFYSALRTEKPYMARHLSWYVKSHDESIEELNYFRNNKIQTSLNDEAMSYLNTQLIYKLYLRSSDDIYEILKRMCDNNNKSISAINVLKACWLLLRKKIL